MCCLMFCVWLKIAEWFCLWYVMYIEEKNMHVKTRMKRTLLPFDVSQILNIVQLGRCRCCCGKFVFKPRLIFIHVIIPKMISLWTDFRLWRKRVLDGVSSSIQSVSLWAQPKPLKRTKSYRNCFRKECTRIENGWPACLWWNLTYSAQHSTANRVLIHCHVLTKIYKLNDTEISSSHKKIFSLYTQ